MQHFWESLVICDGTQCVQNVFTLAYFCYRVDSCTWMHTYITGICLELPPYNPLHVCAIHAYKGFVQGSGIWVQKELKILGIITVSCRV